MPLCGGGGVDGADASNGDPLSEGLVLGWLSFSSAFASSVSPLSVFNRVDRRVRFLGVELLASVVFFALVRRFGIV